MSAQGNGVPRRGPGSYKILEIKKCEPAGDNLRTNWDFCQQVGAFLRP